MVEFTPSPNGFTRTMDLIHMIGEHLHVPAYEGDRAGGPLTANWRSALLHGPKDREELPRIEARPTHQEAVHIAVGDEVLDVVGRDASAVQHRRRIGEFRGPETAEGVPNDGGHLR